MQKNLISNPFTPRSCFEYKNKLIWYPGHQAKSLRLLQSNISHIDVVIEVRDARIPFSSTNPQFEQALGRRDRVVVFNKCDLSDTNLKPALISAFKKQNMDVLFTSTKNDDSVKAIINYGIGTSHTPTPT